MEMSKHRQLLTTVQRWQLPIVMFIEYVFYFLKNFFTINDVNKIIMVYFEVRVKLLNC